MSNQNTCLADLEESQAAKVVSVEGGICVEKRLADLGITSGSIIKVLKIAPFSGPVEIEVKGSRMALGRGLASKIAVSPV